MFVYHSFTCAASTADGHSLSVSGQGQLLSNLIMMMMTQLHIFLTPVRHWH